MNDKSLSNYRHARRLSAVSLIVAAVLRILFDDGLQYETTSAESLFLFIMRISLLVLIVSIIMIFLAKRATKKTLQQSVKHNDKDEPR